MDGNPGGVVCDHTARIQSVTVPDAGNWHEKNPISIQTDHGFSSLIWVFEADIRPVNFSFEPVNVTLFTIQDAYGEWRDVPARPGELVAIVGDYTALLSEGTNKAMRQPPTLRDACPSSRPTPTCGVPTLCVCVEERKANRMCPRTACLASNSLIAADMSASKAPTSRT